MKESFLHYVWQFQKFDSSSLIDSDGNAVQVFAVGEHNTNAGPDFLNAKIKIGEILWHGHVEIHVSASAWNQHGHQNDPAYDNVILHIVWNNDLAIVQKDGKSIPTIELQNKVSQDLLLQSDSLLDSPDKIPCSNILSSVNTMQVCSMLEKVGVQRLASKSGLVSNLLKNNAGDWEETAYQMLAKNYGFKINAHPFLKLAQKLPFKILKKHCGNTLQIEALLFGMSGFLDEVPADDYHASLMNEYVFLAKKYKLEGLELNKVEWKYLRLRPANFPSVRISQFAALINKVPRLFDDFISFQSSKLFINQLKVKPSKYWIVHYDFAKKSKRKLLGIGTESLENILINTATPLLAAYSKYKNEQEYMDKAIDLLQNLKPEKNNITNQWTALGMDVKSAFDSQAYIELYNNYCLNKQCLSCNIGVNIMSNPSNHS